MLQLFREIGFMRFGVISQISTAPFTQLKERRLAQIFNKNYPHINELPLPQDGFGIIGGDHFVAVVGVGL
jgi:hypothetical protein